MGHHLTDDGQFKSDRHPDLPAGKIVLSFKDPHAQLGLWVTAMDYREADPELSEDMVTALARLGSAPPRCFVEDAWTWSIARELGIDPRKTVRCFVHVKDVNEAAEVHIVGDHEAVVAFGASIAYSRLRPSSLVISEHVLVAEDEAPARSATDDGRPDFDGFLLALRAERQWSAMLHSNDKTGQAAADQRALQELAAHVETVGKRLGFLGARPSVAAHPTLSAPDLAEWLRTLADDIASKSARPGDSRKHIIARFLAAATLLEGDPSEAWLREAAGSLANGQLPKGTTDAKAVEHLHAAARALDKLGGVSAAMMQEHDAPLLAHDHPVGS